MPTDAIVVAHRRLRPRARLGIPPVNLPCCARRGCAAGPDQRLAAPRRSAMAGLWPPETAGARYGHGRERLGPFSLDNVTAEIEQERPWPPRRTPPWGAERLSLGTPAARRRNARIDRNNSGNCLWRFCHFCGARQRVDQEPRRGGSAAAAGVL